MYELLNPLYMRDTILKLILLHFLWFVRDNGGNVDFWFK